MKTSIIRRGNRIGKLHCSDGVYFISLFINNGETLVRRYAGKVWKNPKTAIAKILEFINN